MRQHGLCAGKQVSGDRRGHRRHPCRPGVPAAGTLGLRAEQAPLDRDAGRRAAASAREELLSIEVHQFPCLSDNYGFLLHDPASGETACIDTPDAEAYLREAEKRMWRITQIWNTHWHPDHAGGNAAIKAATGCTITAPVIDAPKIDGAARTVAHGDQVRRGQRAAQDTDAR